MFVFEKQAREAIRGLYGARSVEVVGRRGIGCTTFAKRIVEWLESAGYAVFTVFGTESARQIDLYGFTSSGVADSLHGAHLGVPGAVDSLARHLIESDRRVIVLDDLENIDESTLAVARICAERTHTPTLFTRTPQTSGSAAMAYSAIDAERIELLPLAFGSIVELVHAVLGAPADMEVSARVYAESGGLTRFACALIEGARSNGNIVYRDGAWRMNSGDLWSPGIRRAVERTLWSLSHAEYEALYLLSLLGRITADELQSFVSPQLAESLESSGFITVLSGPTEAAEASSYPPVVGDYFRQLPAGTLGLRLAREARDAGQLRAPALVAASRSAPNSNTLLEDALRPYDDAIARRLHDRSQAEASDAARAWCESPCAETANRYVVALREEPAAGSTLRSALFKTHVGSDAPAAEAFAVLTHQFLWVILGGRSDFGEVGRRIDRFITLFPGWRAQAESLAIALEVSVDRTGTADERLTRLADQHPETGVVQLVRAFLLVLSGRPRAALDVLDAGEDTAATLMREFRVLTRAVALVATGDAEGSLVYSLAHYREARRSLNRTELNLLGYVACAALLQAGRWDEAAELAARIVGLGRPGFLARPAHAALLRMMSFLAAFSGNGAIAQATLLELREYADIDFPLPGMQPAWTDAISAFREAGSSKAADLLQVAATREHQMGRVASSAALAIAAAVLSPTHSRVDVLSRITANSPEQLHAQFARLARACIERPEDLEALAGAYQQDGDEYLAARLLRACEAGSISAPEARMFAAAAASIEASDGRLRGEATAPPVVRPAGSLTDREREVSLLADSMSNADIASELGVSRRTVENHISRALKKAGLRSRRDLAGFVRDRLH
ncbi:LuxR C-terminal-related transcriptional regulator [Gryllotalpicola reticulitermitis]|uniref:LuxR C-terminal-related transcriptional regulator n=1 Tax=Gryllotalpicola reticulitermitis TaxID=1184153 RepID=A0ABV8QCZ7_9MICO